MNWVRAAVAVVVSGAILSGAATAGPIRWGYSSTSAREEGYSFTGWSEAGLESAPGSVHRVPVWTLIGSHTAPA